MLPPADRFAGAPSVHVADGAFAPRGGDSFLAGVAAARLSETRVASTRGPLPRTLCTDALATAGEAGCTAVCPAIAGAAATEDGMSSRISDFAAATVGDAARATPWASCCCLESRAARCRCKCRWTEAMPLPVRLDTSCVLGVGCVLPCALVAGVPTRVPCALLEGVAIAAGPTARSGSKPLATGGGR